MTLASPESSAIPTPAAASPTDGPRRPWRRGLRAFGRPPRMMGVDVARGLAVIGMIGAHVGVTEDFDWTDVSTWTDLVHGRSSILFAVVAGVSIGLLTGGARGVGDRDLRALRLRLVGRGVAVFAIGLLLEILGAGVAVILTFYGVLFVIVIPFLRWRRRNLLLLSAALAVLGPPLLALLPIVAPNASGGGVSLVLLGMYPVTVWLSLLLAGLAIGRTRLDVARTAVVLLGVGTMVSAVGYGAGALAAPLTAGEGGGSFSSSSYVIGSADPADGDLPDAPVQDFPSGVPASGLDFTGLLCDQYPDGWISCYPEDAIVEALPEPEEFEEPPSSYIDLVLAGDPVPEVLARSLAVQPHSGGIPEVLGSGGLAVAVLGLCLLISRPLRWVLLPVAALGAMPLTAYSAHLVIIVLTVGSAGISEDNGLWIGLTIGLLVAAAVWTQFLGRGPLERVVGRVADAFADPGRPDAAVAPRPGNGPAPSVPGDGETPPTEGSDR